MKIAAKLTSPSGRKSIVLVNISRGGKPPRRPVSIPARVCSLVAILPKVHGATGKHLKTKKRNQEMWQRSCKQANEIAQACRAKRLEAAQ